MLKIVAISIGILLVLIVAFVIRQWMSLNRGTRQRDEKIFARIVPIAQRIEAGQTVSKEEIETLAARPENRFILFGMLQNLKRSDLFPTNYSSSVAQGESALVYWMMHPHELQDAPEAIELVESFTKSIGGQDAEFHVYRYKMPAGHWAAKDGWILGVAGPITRDIEPYSQMPGAFSRVGDTSGKIKPSELVDWYIDMLRQKGMIR